MTYSRDFARDGHRLPVRVRPSHGHGYHVQVGELSYEAEAQLLPDGRLRLRVQGQGHEAAAADTQVRVDGTTWTLERYQVRHGGVETAANGLVEAPMTGTVLKLPVTAGTGVEAGDIVVILTAMKMEHKLQAGMTGTVMEVCVKEGDIVDQGAVLLRIEAEA